MGRKYDWNPLTETGSAHFINLFSDLRIWSITCKGRLKTCKPRLRNLDSTMASSAQDKGAKAIKAVGNMYSQMRATKLPLRC